MSLLKMNDEPSAFSQQTRQTRVTEVFAVNKNKNQRKRGAKDLTLFHEKDQQVLWKEQ
jgi:hypothetical protein